MNSPISKQVGIEMGDNPHQQNERQEDNYFHASRRIPRFQLIEHSALVCSKDKYRGVSALLTILFAGFPIQ
jgi:hypothetical protein